MESKISLIVAAIDFGTTYSGWAFSFKHEYHADPTKNIERNMDLEDETQKSLPAQTVFSLVIRHLKEDMLKTSRDRLGSGHILEDEITWALTVPAIWNDAAKQFMRDAAVQAGIRSEILRIALEPETASIFCRLLPVEKMVEGGEMSNFQPGSKYMVLDAGGGTIDITVHEVMPRGKLKEIHKASGGAWGGIQADEAFKQFIISLIGNPVFCRFQAESKEDYLDMFRDFEIKKRNITPDKDEKITFHFPSTLKDIFEEETDEDLRTAIQQTRFANKVVLSGDKLRVESSVMKNLFSRAIQNIVSHVKEIMKDREVRGISSILMVGGFSESKMLQDAIRSSFPSVKVIIPHEAGLVVLKGAVVFGHSPFSIAQRVCKFTYGVNVSVAIDNNIHDPTKRTEYEDGPHCRDIFDKHVETGQPILLNQTTEEKSYFPLEENQRSITFNIFASTTKSPMYVTDEGCVKLGYVEVDVLDMSVPRKERSVFVSMTFGGTAIEVQGREKRTGKITKATVNFLG